MKFQYMNGLSYTHNNDLLNALLECIKFYLYIHIVFLLTYLNCFIHLTYSQLFINCMFAFYTRRTLAAGRRAPGFLVLLLCANVSMCVCLPPRLLITSGVMWCDIDPIRLVE